LKNLDSNISRDFKKPTKSSFDDLMWFSKVSSQIFGLREGSKLKQFLKFCKGFLR